ncbi:MAG: PH domain-containing protein [Thermoflexales bacterium]
MNTFEPPLRSPTISSVVALVLLCASAIALGIGAAVVPLSLLTFLLGLGAVVLGALAASAGYLLWSLYHFHYHLDRNALIIQWGHIREVVPVREINKVLAGAGFANALRYRRLPLPGWWVGTAHHPELGKMRAFATAEPTEQIIIVSEHDKLIISPSEVSSFVEELAKRIQMGPTQEVTRQRLLPRLLKENVRSDRLAFSLIFLAIALNLVLIACSTALYPIVPGQVPLHFDTWGNPDRLGDKSGLFMPALIGTVVTALNVGLGVILCRPSPNSLGRLMSLILWGGSAAVQVIGLAGLLSIALSAFNGSAA